MSEIECPYCGHDQDIDHDDGFGYEEGVSHEMECEKCEKTFLFDTSISYYYSAEKADCLNGGQHHMTEWVFLWEHQGERTERRRCETCDLTERRVVQPLAAAP